MDLHPCVSAGFGQLYGPRAAGESQVEMTAPRPTCELSLALHNEAAAPAFGDCCVQPANEFEPDHGRGDAAADPRSHETSGSQPSILAPWPCALASASVSRKSVC
jgi:hypothetical protein